MMHAIPSLRRSLAFLAVSGLVLFALPAAAAAGAPDRASVDADPAPALEAVHDLLFQPLPPCGVERLFAAAERDPACVQYCDDEYEYCIDPCMDQGCIDDCKYYRDDCIAGCPSAG